MNEKHYKTGIILGRFQPMHIGHVALVKQALSKAEKVLILIGSSQASRTQSNPFSYEERERLIRKIFDDRVITAPLPDLGIGNVTKWGEYVIENAEKHVGEVDCFFLGSEEKNGYWFTPERREKIDLVELDRSIIQISATEIRHFLKEGDRKSFEQYMDPKVHDEFDALREVILSIE